MSQIKADPIEYNRQQARGRQDLEDGLGEVFTSAMCSEAALQKLLDVFPHERLDENAAKGILASMAEVSTQNVLRNLDSWVARHNLSKMFDDFGNIRDVQGHSLKPALNPQLLHLLKEAPDVELPRRVLQDASVEAHGVHLDRLKEHVREVRKQSDKIKLAIETDVAQIRQLCKQLTGSLAEPPSHQDRPSSE